MGDHIRPAFHRFISNFGLVTVISVFFALIGAIIVMPAILVLAGGFEKEPETG